MGWQESDRPAYVYCYYEEEDWCRQLIMDCEVVLFGGCDDESYIVERLHAGKPIIRISERLYKTGQWKAISPRGLLKKYQDHTKYRNAPVYLLCAGGYVASDFHIVRAYPGKMFCWGYFPETRQYDVDKLLAGKGRTIDLPGVQENGSGDTRIPRLLWAARLIDWKHPELPLKTARFLKQKGYKFRLDIIGGGAMEQDVQTLLADYQLEDCVHLLGYKTPKEVRMYMEGADIYLLTSDRQEGWGAVANEAMNSGCAVVANHMIGAVPYLIRDGYNGLIYTDGKEEELFASVEKLVQDEALCRRLGRHAYETITQTWNAENAAHSLIDLIGELTSTTNGNKPHTAGALYPCAPAPIISERRKKEK